MKDIDDEIEYLSDNNLHNKNKRTRLLKDEEFPQARVVVMLGQKDWISAIAGTESNLSQIYNCPCNLQCNLSLNICSLMFKYRYKEIQIVQDGCKA